MIRRSWAQSGRWFRTAGLAAPRAIARGTGRSRCPAAALVTNDQRQHVVGDRGTVIHDNDLPDGVLKLADVARPGIGNDPRFRVRIKSSETAPFFRRIAIKEGFGERQDIVASASASNPLKPRRSSAE